MKVKQLLKEFQAIAANPSVQKEKYLTEGKKVILTAPVYTPEELVHSLGMVPMGAWGADVELKEAKRYFPTFICSIMQSIVELGIRGDYEGVSAILIPSLCDSLKVLGENWKYAVPSIPFIPMTYPQNRKPQYGKEFTKKGYEKVIGELEKIAGKSFDDDALGKSLQIYNKHNVVMREFSDMAANHPEITAVERSAVFKSAYFMTKEEHTVMVRTLLEMISTETSGEKKTPVMTTGILIDNPSFLKLLDENRLFIVADDVAHESRQYYTNAEADETALDSLAGKFCSMDNCSVLYDVEKKRISRVVDTAKAKGAKGVLAVLTKFCDPEEFDYPLLKKACEEADLPIVLIEIDRQMEEFEQASTVLETFYEILNN